MCKYNLNTKNRTNIYLCINYYVIIIKDMKKYLKYKRTKFGRKKYISCHYYVNIMFHKLNVKFTKQRRNHKDLL